MTVASGGVRVVVVDDNRLTLPGFAVAIAGEPALELAAAFGHAQALEWEGEWAAIDAVVVDAADEERSGDQFPGVAVVRRVRAAAGRRPLIVVVTGHYLHDGLRHRMAAAEADFFFLRSDLRSPEALIDVILHPERHRRGVPGVGDGLAASVLGVDEASDVEAFVGWVDERELGPAMAGDVHARADPRSRRWARIRREASAAGRVGARNLTTGDVPLGQTTPSIRQLARLWEWAARIRRPVD